VREKISIIGAGSWGTTLGILLAKKGGLVELHSVFREHNLEMQRKGENSLFLKGVKFPPKLKVVLSLKEALENKIVVIAIPVKFLRKVLRRIKRSKCSLENKIFVSVAKGIEALSLKRPSQIIEEELGKLNLVVLSGPTIAGEVIKGVPTACVVASKNNTFGELIQNIFNTGRLRIYTHKDVVGVELGGALKNIVAIACGISDGLGFGTNTKAALVTRGLVEIIRLGKKLGASPATFTGISGLGDLVTTCFSPYSRNRFVGERIGQGKSLKDILKKMEMVAEGVETVKSAYQLSKKLNIDMPITREVYLVLYKNKSPKKAVVDLMGRPLKSECIG
jgi:glycerol-3-phosphate dehydrogenase (NAD(P)+)